MPPASRHSPIIPALCVFAGGALGTAIRAGFSFLQPASVTWPYVTFVVNLCGAFILGFLLEYLSLTGKDEGGRKLFRLFAGTGIMGGFTTYGTFILEVDSRFQAHKIGIAVAYAIVSVVCGLVLAGLGVMTANAVANHSANKYARAHHLPELPEDFGTPDLDAPDAFGDPGHLETSAPAPASNSEHKKSDEHEKGGAR
jgi:protein CrcB